MTERASRLSEYRFAWSLLTTDAVASILHWLMLMVLTAVLIWLARGLGLRSWPLPERPHHALPKVKLAETMAARPSLETQSQGGEL